MSIPIEMPKLSDTMTEGTLVRWVKKIGEKVKVGDVLAEVETDKATMEMEAFDDGTLGEILVKDGEKVEVGQKLALLLEPGEKANSEGASSKSSKEKVTDPPRETAVSTAKEIVKTASTGTGTGATKATTPTSNTRVKASPLAKKVATELGIDIQSLTGTGPGGRIIRDDVTAASKTGTALSVSTPSSTAKPVQETTDDQVIPLTGMRRTIAARLLEAKATIPHFYLQSEVDVEPLVKLRQELNTSLETEGKPKLTVNDFILKATAVAAVKVPRANASFTGDATIQYGAVQLACAVALDDGLITPVIRNAQAKSLTEISFAIKDLANRARSKKLKPEEFQGGTITVSNLGGYGVEQFFAIINPPGAVIISVGAIVKKPIINQAGEIAPGQRMAIGISCDHRVVDGAIGAQFLSELKKLIEQPSLMLI
jgi:pyruvate dehydrogenase E2 component (dihydrolipoamide acetyltransferase)